MYKIAKKNGVKVIKIEVIERMNMVKHGFSTRVGGVSHGIYSTMNFGFRSGDTEENVRTNYKKLCQVIGVNYDDLVLSDQIHDDKIRIVTEKDKGKGIIYEKDYRGIDALITNVPRIPLVTFHADCVPLLLLDPIKKVVAAVHAGWRGTALRLSEKTLRRMMDTFDCRPEDIIVAIGPSIGPCCYEVSQEVIDKFNMNFTKTSSFIDIMGKGKYMLNLWEANKMALKDIGILEGNIINSQLCTSCNLDLFYSHRTEKGLTGRMISVIQLI